MCFCKKVEMFLWWFFVVVSKVNNCCFWVSLVCKVIFCDWCSVCFVVCKVSGEWCVIFDVSCKVYLRVKLLGKMLLISLVCCVCWVVIFFLFSIILLVNDLLILWIKCCVLFVLGMMLRVIFGNLKCVFFLVIIILYNNVSL